MQNQPVLPFPNAMKGASGIGIARTVYGRDELEESPSEDGNLKVWDLAKRGEPGSFPANEGLFDDVMQGLPVRSVSRTLVFSVDPSLLVRSGLHQRYLGAQAPYPRF